MISFTLQTRFDGAAIDGRCLQEPPSEDKCPESVTYDDRHPPQKPFPGNLYIYHPVFEGLRSGGPGPSKRPKDPMKGDIVALWQGKSKKKNTGGRLVRSRGKRRFEIGREIHLTVVGHTSRKPVRTRGNNVKQRALLTNEVNVTDPRTRKTVKARIVTVVENPANPHYVRRNILTKGTVVETEMGNVRITSRPGQHGVVNGVLVAK